MLCSSRLAEKWEARHSENTLHFSWTFFYNVGFCLNKNKWWTRNKRPIRNHSKKNNHVIISLSTATLKYQLVCCVCMGMQEISCPHDCSSQYYPDNHHQTVVWKHTEISLPDRIYLIHHRYSIHLLWVNIFHSEKQTIQRANFDSGPAGGHLMSIITHPI